jgi:hypothetical protein
MVGCLPGHLGSGDCPTVPWLCQTLKLPTKELTHLAGNRSRHLLSINQSPPDTLPAHAHRSRFCAPLEQLIVAENTNLGFFATRRKLGVEQMKRAECPMEL